jgi:hypothetical protein
LGAKFVNTLFSLSACANPIFHPYDNAADGTTLFYLKLRIYFLKTIVPEPEDQ